MDERNDLKYWVVSAPNEGVEEEAVFKLKRAVERGRAAQHFLVKFPPSLRVGTLDSLMALSDDLVKKDQDSAQALTKIASIYHDFSEGKEEMLYVNRKHPEKFVETFKWNTQQFSPSDSLHKLVDNITSNVSRNLQVLMKIQTTINGLKTKLTQLESKSSGSLAIRDLNEFVPRKEWIDGPYITSMLVVVPLQRKEEFLENYDKLESGQEVSKYRKQLQEMENKLAEEKSDENAAVSEKLTQLRERVAAVDKLKGAPMVIPGSAMGLTADSEFALYRVVLMRSYAEVFGFICKDRRYIVRKFNIDDSAARVDKKQMSELSERMIKEKRRLVLLCRSYFSEVFIGYLHLVMIRVFVESVLRYGLPINFSINFIKPQAGATTRLKKTLEGLYAHLASNAVKEPVQRGKKGRKKGGADNIDYSGLGSDFRSYVFSEIMVEY